MRILHVVHTPRFSGAEILVASLTETHLKMGHISQVVSFNPPEDNFIPVINKQYEQGINWVYPISRPSKFGRLLFIAKAKKKFRPDVIFAHSVIPAVYARLVSPKKVITVLHAENNYGSRYFSSIEYLLQRVTLGVIAVSKTAREKYSEVFSGPATKYIPNGIDVKKFENNLEARCNIRSQLGLSDNGFMILQVGRIDKVKQQHLSVLALKSLIKTNPNIQLYFIGLVEDVGYLSGIKDLVEESGLSGNIHFLGPSNDVAGFLSAADLFLMPSVREAQGIALMEALASGIPIIASDLDNFLFAKPYDGVLFHPPEDIAGLGELIKNQILHRSRYKRDVLNMSIDVTADEYINFALFCFAQKL